MKIINFLDIYDALLQFKPNIQFSYLTKQEIIKNFNFPIKEYKSRQEILKIKEKIYNISKNSICLIIVLPERELCQSILKELKRSPYRLKRKQYNSPFEALSDIAGIKIEEYRYLNKKIGAVEAGLGQYGKNQLIYNQFFGFDIHIQMFIIDNNVINLPMRNKPNYGLLSLCDGCNLCEKNCPAKAIHLEDGKPFWLDANACRTFFTYGDHPNISTVKYSINKFLHNKYSNEELLKVVDNDSFKKLFGFEEQETVVNLNGKYYQINFDYCQECRNQAPCRKILHTYNRDNFDATEIKSEN